MSQSHKINQNTHQKSRQVRSFTTSESSYGARNWRKTSHTNKLQTNITLTKKGLRFFMLQKSTKSIQRRSSQSGLPINNRQLIRGLESTTTCFDSNTSNVQNLTYPNNDLSEQSSTVVFDYIEDCRGSKLRERILKLSQYPQVYESPLNFCRDPYFNEDSVLFELMSSKSSRYLVTKVKSEENVFLSLLQSIWIPTSKTASMNIVHTLFENGFEDVYILISVTKASNIIGIARVKSIHGVSNHSDVLKNSSRPIYWLDGRGRIEVIQVRKEEMVDLPESYLDENNRRGQYVPEIVFGIEYVLFKDVTPMHCFKKGPTEKLTNLEIADLLTDGNEIDGISRVREILKNIQTYKVDIPRLNNEAHLVSTLHGNFTSFLMDLARFESRLESTVSLISLANILS